jgi:HlyD family secretion protein
VKDRYVISAPLSGNLARIELHAGDAVDVDTVLARIVPIAPPLLDARTRAEAEGRVRAATASRAQTGAMTDRATAALDFARREVARLRALAGRDVVERRALELAELEERTRASELESARFATKIAGWELQIARSALGHIEGGPRTAETQQQMEITSPVRGHVLRVVAQSEGVVAAGTPLLEVGDPAALEIVVDVLTSDAVQVRPGATAEVDGWGGDRTLPARVRLVEPSAFTRASALGVEEQRVNVVLDLLDPPQVWSALGDGYRVEARIVVWEKDDVLQVPSSALFRHDGGWAVWTVAEGRAQRRAVAIGRQAGLVTEILRGVRAGDAVIEHPSDAVAEGVEVARR